MKIEISSSEYKNLCDAVQKEIEGIEIEDPGEDSELKNIPKASTIVDLILQELEISS